MESFFVIFDKISDNKGGRLEIEGKNTLETPAPQWTSTLPDFSPTLSSSSTFLYFLSHFIKVLLDILCFLVFQSVTVVPNAAIILEMKSVGCCNDYDGL